MTAKDAIDEWNRADGANRSLNPADKIAGVTAWLRRAGVEDADLARLQIHPRLRWLDWVGRILMGAAVASLVLQRDFVSGDSILALGLAGLTVSLVASRALSYDKRVARSIQLPEAHLTPKCKIQKFNK